MNQDLTGPEKILAPKNGQILRHPAKKGGKLPKIMGRGPADTVIRISKESQRFASRQSWAGSASAVSKFNLFTEHCEYPIACPAWPVVRSSSSRGDTSINDYRLVGTTVAAKQRQFTFCLSTLREYGIRRTYNKENRRIARQGGWVETLYVG